LLSILAINDLKLLFLKEYLNCFYLHGNGALPYVTYREDYVYDLYTVTDETIVEENSSHSYPL